MALPGIDIEVVTCCQDGLVLPRMALRRPAERPLPGAWLTLESEGRGAVPDPLLTFGSQRGMAGRGWKGSSADPRRCNVGQAEVLRLPSRQLHTVQFDIRAP